MNRADDNALEGYVSKASTTTSLWDFFSYPYSYFIFLIVWYEPLGWVLLLATMIADCQSPLHLWILLTSRLMYEHNDYHTDLLFSSCHCMSRILKDDIHSLVLLGIICPWRCCSFWYKPPAWTHFKNFRAGSLSNYLVETNPSKILDEYDIRKTNELVLSPQHPLEVDLYLWAMVWIQRK